MSFENVTAALGYVPGIGATGATTAYVDAKIVATITNGDTTHAPSGDAVFDALALKADLASPALTGNPTAPTPTPGDNDTSIATTAFVTAAVAAGGGGGGLSIGLALQLPSLPAFL